MITDLFGNLDALGMVIQCDLQVSTIMAESLKDDVRQHITEECWPKWFDVIDKHTHTDTKGDER